MSIVEIVFYIAIGIGNLIIATEWAKYGILEIGIQRPINSRAIAGVLLGSTTFVIGGIMHRISGFNPVNKYAIALVIGSPIFWLLVYRYILIPPGLFDFNRARIRTNYWMLSSYRPGKILQEKGSNLREFTFAKGAIRMFRKVIEAQSKGVAVRTVTKKVELDDEIIDYDRNANVNCPVCGINIKVPIYADEGVLGACNLCGSAISARRFGNTLYLEAILKKPTRIVSDKNKYNVAIGYEELALLYRMMNMFYEAERALKGGMEVVEDLISKNSDYSDYLSLRSLILFRIAELNHVQGKLEQASRGYEESLAIDRELGNEEGIRTIEELLKQI